MSISKRAALCALMVTSICGGASAANAAYFFTATVTASGSGFNRPDPANDFNRQNPVSQATVQIAFAPTDDPNYFIGIVNDFTYEASFSDAGLTIGTLSSGMQPYPVIYAATCYTGGPAAGSQSFGTGCGAFSLSASFGGPPITSFNGSVTSLLIEDGDTTDGRGASYSVGVAAIPEPSTWALMLAGFSMVGYAMRRRKVAFA